MNIHSQSPGRDGDDLEGIGARPLVRTGHSSTQSGARRAEQTLEWMLGLYAEHRLPSLKPTAAHFVTIMSAYAKSGERDLAQRVEGVLRRMEDYHRSSGDVDVKPNHQCFVVCIDAWARSGNKGAAERAERILERLEKLYFRDGVDAQGRMQQHGQGNGDCDDDPDGRSRLNNFGFNLVLEAWSNSREAGRAQRADQVFQRLKHLHEQTGDNGLKPDRVSYSSLMKAIVSERLPGFALRVRGLLDEMERHQDDDNVSTISDEVCYLCVLDAYAKDGDVGAVEKIFRRMQKRNIPPYAPCYNAVMNAWAKSRRPDAGNRAEALLMEMEDEFLAGHVKASPTRVSYTTCLDALSRSKDPNRVARARAVFGRMVQRSKEGNDSAQPNVITMTTLITVLARSDMPDKAERALGIFESMENFGVKPVRTVYNAVLNACARTVCDDMAVRRRALQIATDIFQRLRKSGEGPDSISYSSLLHACRTLIENMDERTVAVEDLFVTCCNDGLVSDAILSALTRTVPEPVYWAILGRKPSRELANVSDLPSEWSRNTRKDLGQKKKYMKPKS